MPVKIKISSGQVRKCRALRDIGSETSFIIVQCVHQLSLKRQKSKIVVSDIGGHSNTANRGIVNLEISDKCPLCHRVSALIQTKLTDSVPTQPAKLPKSVIRADIDFLDPDFHKPVKIDIILGIDIFEKKMLNLKKDSSLTRFSRRKLYLAEPSVELCLPKNNGISFLPELQQISN